MQCIDGACGLPEAPSPADGGGDGTAGADVAPAADAPADVPEVPKGAFMEPCTTNLGCDSGWCMDASGGGYCSHTCAEEPCPDGWACRAVANTGADAVLVCVKDHARLCQPCESDVDCGDGGVDRCLEVGGGHFCGRDCSAEPCPTGYSCGAVPTPAGQAMQCVPVSGSCDCSSKNPGQVKGCEAVNDAGTCYGEAVCDPALGWIGCDAPAPAAEACNGQDDDCDGTTDEDLAPTGCVVVGAAGTCTGQRTCQGPLGWVCSAKAPEEETCNGQDDDCDGMVDEGFIDASGAYLTPESCGSCGSSCQDKLAFAAEVACVVEEGAPTCVALACDPGFVLFAGKSCLSENALLCQPCAKDSDCFGELSKCVQPSATDPRTFCARDCSGQSGFSKVCPNGYSCTPIGDGLQCVPVTGSCDCGPGNAGQEKACFRDNDFGTCFGEEICDPLLGWVGCTAPEPEAESCNGSDDDCDGLVDELAVLAVPCAVTSAAGSCPGVMVCGGAAGEVCSAKTPSVEACNGLDDDCDGGTDEGFTVGGKIGASPDNCGACGYSCPPVAHGTVVCDPGPIVPVCKVALCDDGYYAYLGIACLPLPAQLPCGPCASDGDCPAPGDRCLDEPSGSYCGRDCAAGSVWGSACTGQTGVQGCCPDGWLCQPDEDGPPQCRPVSGTCTCIEDGLAATCAVTNVHGTCIGKRTCDVTSGWTACTAATPKAEVCDGYDDDCDGVADDGVDPASTPLGSLYCGTPPGCIDAWTCSGGAWSCPAKAPAPEACNGADDDCDGLTDEDFKSQGQYVGVAHCGGCGFDCDALLPHSAETACVLQAGKPTCMALSCEPGAFLWQGGKACLPLPENLCQACSTAEDCLVPSSQCVTLGEEKVCARDCSASSPWGPGCPDGYECVPVGAWEQCVPKSGTCLCSAETLGLVRGCTAGACQGLETCVDQGSSVFGFATCSADGVVPEVCDGLDNDCDGATDEPWLGESGTYDTDQACGVCGNDCTLLFDEGVQHAVGACDTLTYPPACHVASCTTTAEGEWVDTNGVADDGCECVRQPGNTSTDDPDVVFLAPGATSPSFPLAGATTEDANCDGIDGVASASLFVRAGSPGPGDGSRASPFPTIGQALTALATSGKAAILVAGGVYEETVTLSAGARLHGGYAPDFGSRDIVSFPSEIRGQAGAPAAVRAVGLHGPKTLFSGFVVVGLDLPASAGLGTAGVASVAMWLADCDSSLEVRNTRVVGGAGQKGGGGTSGTTGFGVESAGGAALVGLAGVDAGACSVGPCAGKSASGGAGGKNAACPLANGASGGAVVCPVYNTPSYMPVNPARDGTPGWSWTLDNASGSDCGFHATEAGYPSAIKNANGGNGLTGPDGASGTQGGGCTSGEGAFVGGAWVGGAALGGQTGAPGEPGGVGGASGGIDSAPANAMPAGVGAFALQRYKLGATGGGAGAGGCGGTGGGPGGSGGASIALLVTFAGSPSSVPVLAGNAVLRGPGGSGGTGGYGGSGGAGGDGGEGGDSAGYWIDFRAGNGGRGGRGGVGGGGGGCGGASLGIAVVGVAAGTSLDYGDANTMLLPESVPTGGAGGLGGPSGASSPQAQGAAGAAKNLLVKPGG